MGLPAVGLTQQGLALRRELLEGRVIPQASHHGGIQRQRPEGLQRHIRLGPQQRGERHVEQVGEGLAAALPQSFCLLLPETALLQRRLRPQQIEPRHQPRTLQGRHLITHQGVVAYHRLADAQQLIRQLQAVVGLAHLELQLAQGIAVLLKAGGEALILLRQGSAALEADQLPIQIEAAPGAALVGLDPVPAVLRHQESRLWVWRWRHRHRWIDGGVVLEHQVVVAALGEGAAQIECKPRPEPTHHRAFQATHLSDTGAALSQIRVIGHRHAEGLGQAEHPFLGLIGGGGRQGRRLGIRSLQGGIREAEHRRTGSLRPQHPIQLQQIAFEGGQRAH